MNRYLYIFLFLCFFTILTFVVFEASGLSFEGLLENTTSKVTLAVVGVLLLGVDVLLPIPSSVVMISNGVLFGAVSGGILSTLGGLLASALGYYIGAKSSRLAEKMAGGTDEARAKAFLERYGYVAIIASRPIPVLAESVAIISGTIKLSFRKVMVNSLIGLIPISFIYSVTGAYSTSLDSSLWAFVLNLSMAGILWLVTWRKTGKGKY